MKFIIILLFLLIAFLYSCDFSKDKDTSTKSKDGPYLFYNNDGSYLKSIIEKNGALVCETKSLPIHKDSIILSCQVDDLYSFSFPIKDSLRDEACIFSTVNKIFAISDIEGNFHTFAEYLQNNGIVDKKFNWIYRNGHLVLNGDFFDRGLYVTECLWLIYKLEEEAIKSGGKVHFIIGNHELMNFNGDYSSVRNKYKENAQLMGEEYKNWFAENTELGRWIRTKNCVEKIGDYLFVHGGISKQMNELSTNIEEINKIAKSNYFNEDSAMKSNDNLLATIFDQDNGPFWYRGYIKNKASEKQIENTLQNFGVKKIVVGHTPVKNVSYFYGKKVIAIDTKHTANKSNCLLIENEEEYKVDRIGNRDSIKEK